MTADNTDYSCPVESQSYTPQWASADYPKPIYAMTIDGQPLGQQSAARLMSLSLRDCRGFEADQLDIELSDHDGLLDFPSQDTLIKLWLGFEGSGLEYKGEYKVSEYSHSGAPDKLKITARAADLAAELAESREKSWHNTTVYNIVSAIASRHKYEAKISESFKDEKIPHIDQTNESDASFLTRLAEQCDAIATIKNGMLLFITAGDATTASGQLIPLTLITRDTGDSHTYTQSATENYQAVKAFYKSPGKGQKNWVVITKDNLEPPKKPAKPKSKRRRRRRKGGSRGRAGAPKPPPIDTGGMKVKTLRHVYATHGNAERGARAAFKKLKRGLAQFKISLALGRPELFTETPAEVSGFKPAIDGQIWLIKELTHKLDNSGLTTDIDLEMKISEDKEGEEK